MHSFVFKPAAGFLAIAIVFAGCRVVTCTCGPKRVAIKDIAEFKNLVGAAGLYIHSGSQSGLIGDNFYVADHPLAWDDLEEVHSRRDCGLTPAWRGILWVCQINTANTTNLPDSIGGKCRVWGNVCVVGDEELMDRMEALYREQGVNP
jgi:hypothetical protein